RVGRLAWRVSAWASRLNQQRVPRTKVTNRTNTRFGVRCSLLIGLAAISRQKFRHTQFRAVGDIPSRAPGLPGGVRNGRLLLPSFDEMLGAPRFRHKKRAIPIRRRAMLIPPM